MSFLHMEAVLSLCQSVRSSDIQAELKAEPLLICVERSQLRWFGNLARKPPSRLHGDVFWAFSGGTDPGHTGKFISIDCSLDSP